MNPLHKKLLIKSDQRILLLNAPDNILKIIGELPQGTLVFDTLAAEADLIIGFVLNRAELHRIVSTLIPIINDNTVLWICYPKKSSGIKSDLTMASWDLSDLGLSGIAAISISEQWTAIRLKRSNQVKRSGVGNAEIAKNELGKYIDVENKIVTLPSDLEGALKEDREAMDFFNSLSYSNRKEYVTWILTAKQEKTRVSRIEKSTEKLRAKKKNPAA